MKLITRNTDYAIRAICYMAKKKNKLVSVTELVDALNVPRQFLRKILQVLSRKKVVRSCKGIGGGFSLPPQGKDIHLIDLIKTFQGPLKLNECFLKRELCPNRMRCPLKKRIDRIERLVLAELSSITIKDLAGR